MPFRPAPRAASLAIPLLLVLALAPAAAAPEGWSVRWADPPVLIAPLDVQLIPGAGDDPALIALLDPGSNSAKVRFYDLDGNPVGTPLLANGPDPWSSTVLPFTH
ncbi:MAG TPA: hypothetical protein VEI97_03790, partial [bacterium]|nr:hypothetical protein [bacterium]